jgi:hypothetical protein
MGVVVSRSEGLIMPKIMAIWATIRKIATKVAWILSFPSSPLYLAIKKNHWHSHKYQKIPGLISR